jgi:hypothetical protein
LLLSTPVHVQDAQLTKVRTTEPTQVRSAPRADGPVLEEVPANTYFDLVRDEGDWYRVRLPGDPRLGGVRVEAYVAKAVAALATAEEAAAAAADALRPPPPGEGVSVGLDLLGGRTIWVPAVATRPVAVAGGFRSTAEAASNATLEAAVLGTVPPPPATPDEVTWVWVTGTEDDPPSIAQQRPNFFVSYGNVRGLNPGNFAPEVVRLLPVGSVAYLVSMATGRADARTSAQVDWRISRVLTQDELRISLEGSGPGLMMVRVRSTLPPGRYAVVLRPSTARNYSGAQILSWEGPGLAFSAAWPFVVQ